MATRGRTKLKPKPKDDRKKECPICKKEKSISKGFYKSSSPLFANDGCVPICINCVKKEVLNEDGTVNEKKLKIMCQRLDKPFYIQDLDSAWAQCRAEHGYLSDDEVAKLGEKIVGYYFKNINTLRQNTNKSFADSEKDGFVHRTKNYAKEQEKDQTFSRYSNFLNKDSEDINNKEDITLPSPYHESPAIKKKKKEETPVPRRVEEDLVYNDFWMGDYSKKDIDLLDKYYNALNRDYKIVTENHRDYAKKIAKASLMMDKAYDDMLRGVNGAEKMYASAKDIFDSLSKSAKFSEDKRSNSDVGISSFSKIVSMVEAHNWIPEYVPKEKDMYDEMLDALRVINQSV